MKRIIWFSLTYIFLVLLALWLIIFRDVPTSAGVSGVAGISNQGDSYIHLFEPSTNSFIFTFTIPVANVNPQDLLVLDYSDHKEIWIAGYGADIIGKLIYTDITYSSFVSYPLESGSSPLSLAWGNGFIWFTEAGRDRIGRLNPNTGMIEEFLIGAGRYPAGLDVASDGSIWFTEMEFNQLGHLVITSTTDYSVEEYAITATSDRPYGIGYVKGVIYFTLLGGQLGRFTPPDSWLYSQSGLEGPYRLKPASLDAVWFVERDGNRLAQWLVGTNTIIARYLLSPEASMPVDLELDSGGMVWFCQWNGRQIGKFDPVAAQASYYPLPKEFLAPTAIAVDKDNYVWVTTVEPYTVYLPLVKRE